MYMQVCMYLSMHVCLYLCFYAFISISVCILNMRQKLEMKFLGPEKNALTGTGIF
jgi:hypothetical protein